MVLALSGSHEAGLAAMAAAFIIFSLVSSFVLPRRNLNFPGRGRNGYILLSVLFFAGMMSCVVLLGKEPKEGEAQAAAGTQSTPSQTQPAPAASGDAAAGKAVFDSVGCSSCHTFAPAGASGKVGPDLDKLKDSAATAKQPLDQFIETSITDPNAYIAPGFSAGVMPKLPLTKKQVDDLVAFLSSGS